MYISYDQNFISLHCTTYLLELFRKCHFFDKCNKNVTEKRTKKFFILNLYMYDPCDYYDPQMHSYWDTDRQTDRQTTQIYNRLEILRASLADFLHFANAKWCFCLTPHNFDAPGFVFAIQLWVAILCTPRNFARFARRYLALRCRSGMFSCNSRQRMQFVY